MAKPKDHSQDVNDYESKRDGNNEESNFYSTGERVNEHLRYKTGQTVTQIVFCIYVVSIEFSPLGSIDTN